jgi:hypothetical protein
MNPYNISWPCQSDDGSTLRGEAPVLYIHSQADIPTTA